MARGQKSYVCVAPVSSLVDANQDFAYQQILNNADMVTPDGMPVVWLLQAHGNNFVRRTYGPDLMKKLCLETPLRHYFYGGTESVLNELEQRLKKDRPGIKIVGMCAPPFRPQAVVEPKAVVDAINAVNPDIVWVALGSPKQDYWMQLNRQTIDAPVIIAVGAAFDFLAGVKPQAPKWMQQCGLEWFFRLCSEPKRLWKRYVFGNTLFLIYCIKYLLKNPK